MSMTQEQIAEQQRQKTELLERKSMLEGLIAEGEAHIAALPEALQSLAPTLRVGIESHRKTIADIEEALKRIALAEEQQRHAELNNKILHLIGENVINHLTDEEKEMLVNRTSLCIRFSRMQDGRIAVTTSVTTSTRPARGTSVDKPGDARERGARRMIIDRVACRQFSTWRGVLDAYGIDPNGSSALKVAANMFTDFATRFIDVDGKNFVQELLDKTVPYTIGTSDDAYPHGYMPAEVYGGVPIERDAIPAFVGENRSSTTGSSNSASIARGPHLPSYITIGDDDQDDYPGADDTQTDEVETDEVENDEVENDEVGADDTGADTFEEELDNEEPEDEESEMEEIEDEAEDEDTEDEDAEDDQYDVANAA